MRDDVERVGEDSAWVTLRSEISAGWKSHSAYAVDAEGLFRLAFVDAAVDVS